MCMHHRERVRRFVQEHIIKDSAKMLFCILGKEEEAVNGDF